MACPQSVARVRMTKWDAELPIYIRIARILRSRIFHGLYVAGASLPSENDLAREFRVARLTVRQAIQELRGEGALTARKGSGTFVPLGFEMVRPVHFRGYLEDLVLQSLAMKTDLTGIRTVPAPSDVRAAYGLASGAMVVRFDRVRSVGDTPAEYSINFLRRSLARRLSLTDLEGNSLADMMSRQTGIQMDSVSQRFSAVPARHDTARILHVKVGAPLLFGESVGFDASRRPLNFARVYYRPEHTFFTAELTSISSDVQAIRSHAEAATSHRNRITRRSRPGIPTDD